MSLQHAAKHLESKGRFGDDMLVHMSKGEVNSLQQLAKAHGGSLTINPETGLPEAGFLQALMPTIIGAGVGAATMNPALGAAAAGMYGYAQSGSITQGLLAGLQGYGGAGLTEGMTLGTAGTQLAPGELAAQQELARQQITQQALNTTQDAGLNELAVHAGQDVNSLQGMDKFVGQNGMTNLTPTVVDPYAATATNYGAMGQAPLGTTPVTPVAEPVSGVDLGGPGSSPTNMGAPQSNWDILNKNATFKNLAYALGPAVLSDAMQRQQQGMPQPAKHGTSVAPTYTAGQNMTGISDIDMGGRGRRWLNPSYTPGVYYASGGAVEQMSNANAIGANTGYPQADVHTGAYATPWQSPISQNVLQGTQDTRVDPYTGEEKFAEGGTTVSGSVDLHVPINSEGGGGVGSAFTSAGSGTSTANTTHANDFSSGYNNTVNGFSGQTYQPPAGGASNPFATQSQNQLQSGDGSLKYVNPADDSGMGEAMLRSAAANGQSVTNSNATPLSLGGIYNQFLGAQNMSSGIQTLASGGSAGTGGIAMFAAGGGIQTSEKDVGNVYSLAKGMTKDKYTPKDYTGYYNDRSKKLDSLSHEISPLTAIKPVKGVQSDGIPTLTEMQFAQLMQDQKARSLPAKDYTGYYANVVNQPQRQANVSGISGYAQGPQTQSLGRGYQYNQNLSTPVQDPMSGAKQAILNQAENAGYFKENIYNTMKDRMDFLNGKARSIVGKGPSTADKDRLAGTGLNRYTGAQTVSTPAMPQAASNYNYAPQAQQTQANTAGISGYQSGVAPQASGYQYAPAAGAATGVTGKAKGGLTPEAHHYMASGGVADGHYNLGGYSDGGRLLRGPGDGVSDSIPAVIGHKQPARLADGEFVIPARIVSELGNGSTEAGARKLYAMMDRVQKARSKTVGKGKIATNTKADKHLPA